MPKNEGRSWFTAALMGAGLTVIGMVESFRKRPAPETKEDSEPTHRDVMFEARDVDASVIGWIAVGVIVAAFLIHGIVKMSYGYFSRTEFRNQQPVTLVQQAAPSPTVPTLQVNPSADLERLQESERMALSSYGWVDQQKGIVRTPIDEAMKRVVEKGLPAAEAASPTPTASPTK